MKLFPVLADVMWSPLEIATIWLFQWIIPAVLVIAVVAVVVILIRNRRK